MKRKIRKHGAAQKNLVEVIRAKRRRNESEECRKFIAAAAKFFFFVAPVLPNAPVIYDQSHFG